MNKKIIINVGIIKLDYHLIKDHKQTQKILKKSEDVRPGGGGLNRNVLFLWRKGICRVGGRISGTLIIFWVISGKEAKIRKGGGTFNL